MHVRCVKRPHIHAQGHDRSPFPAAASRKVSLLGNDNLEVFAGNDHGLVARGVEATDQVDNVARKRFAAGVLKRLKCLEPDLLWA